MSIVNRRADERVTTLDLLLMQRLRRREAERIAAHATSESGAWGPRTTGGGGVGERRFGGTVLGGLEVSISLAALGVLQISAGDMVTTNASAGHETRPGTWSGRVEEDDHGVGVFHYPGGSITPTIANDPAWQWILVYGTIAASKTVETNSDYKTFNQGTGVFDSTSAAKVVEHGITIGHTVGSPGATVPALPSADSFPIAWIYVPPSQTNLAKAQIFDVRKMPHRDPGPNVVEGSWWVGASGAITTPFTQDVFSRLAVRARLDGEWLEAIGTGGLHTVQVCEGGATWDATASASAPKIAWLYLCRPRGVVPRLKAIGGYAPGSHPSVQVGPLLSGCLVLSPNPPRIYNNGSIIDSARKWDLRNGTALGALPNQGGIKGQISPAITADMLSYQWYGMTAAAGDGICVGMVLYTGVDVGGLPEIAGTFGCFDGWHRGNVLKNATTNPFLSALAANTMSGAGVQVTATVRDVGTEETPLDNVEVQIVGTLTSTAAGASIDWNHAHAGKRSVCFTGPGPTDLFSFVGEMPVFQAGTIVGLTIEGDASDGAVSTVDADCTAVRMPFGRPLVT